MGQQYRLISLCSGALVLAASVAAAGCGKDEVQRRELLQGRDRVQEAREHIAKKRVIALDGALVPSEVVIGGVVLPRGFSFSWKIRSESVYEADLPLPKVEAYFGQRLSAERVDRTPQRDIEFVEAREKSTPGMKPVFLRLSPMPGREDSTRITVIEPVDTVAEVPSPSEAARRLATSRRYAR